MKKTIIGRIVDDKCYVCGGAPARVIVKLDNDTVELQAPACVRCAMLAPQIIWDAVTSTKGVFVDVRV